MVKVLYYNIGLSQSSHGYHIMIRPIYQWIHCICIYHGLMCKDQQIYLWPLWVVKLLCNRGIAYQAIRGFVLGTLNHYKSRLSTGTLLQQIKDKCLNPFYYEVPWVYIYSWNLQKTLTVIQGSNGFFLCRFFTPSLLVTPMSSEIGSLCDLLIIACMHHAGNSILTFHFVENHMAIDRGVQRISEYLQGEHLKVQ